MPDRVSVGSADFIRNIGHWQTEALAHPVSITHHGRERLVLCSSERFSSHEESFDARGGGPSKVQAWQDALLANIEQGFVQFDCALAISATNHIAQGFFGLTDSSLKALSPDIVFTELLNGNVRNALLRVGRTRVAEGVETVLSDKRVLSMRAFPVPDGVGILFSDISEQLQSDLERAEASALRTSLAVFQDIGEVQIDVRGRICRVDSALARALGFSASQLIDHKISDIVDSSVRRLMNATMEALQPEKPPQLLDVTFISRLGDPIEARLSMTPVFHQYTPQGAVCVVALAA